MKNLVKFIWFLIYTIGIFFIQKYIFLLLILLFNLLVLLIYKISFLKALKNILKLLPFIIFTVIINIIFMDFKYAVLIGIKLILVCNICYIFSKTITYMEFGEMIEKIVTPFKLFGINPKDIGLVIVIAFAFIPIMKQEIGEIKNVLKVKGIRFTNFNIIKYLQLVFKPFFVSVLYRLNEVELSLREKGYQ